MDDLEELTIDVVLEGSIEEATASFPHLFDDVRINKFVHANWPQMYTTAYDKVRDSRDKKREFAHQAIMLRQKVAEVAHQLQTKLNLSKSFRSGHPGQAVAQAQQEAQFRQVVEIYHSLAKPVMSHNIHTRGLGGKMLDKFKKGFSASGGEHPKDLATKGLEAVKRDTKKGASNLGRMLQSLFGRRSFHSQLNHALGNGGRGGGSGSGRHGFRS